MGKIQGGYAHRLNFLCASFELYKQRLTSDQRCEARPVPEAEVFLGFCCPNKNWREKQLEIGGVKEEVSIYIRSLRFPRLGMRFAGGFHPLRRLLSMNNSSYAGMIAIPSWE